MHYNILQARIDYKQGNIDRITVLVEMSENDLRAMQATTMPRLGYRHIQPGAKLTDELLQQVAGYGYEVEIDFLDWTI